ncbi:MAG: amino acid ABC transporter periplasmic protein [Candidatus Magnetoglobus multicellularis str. Araruama]|uniref:Amino acid ABC transporter periplasmic protein n=1 Tax=Candidatus Magnetoglobus multicellularis str. Araruama TaxID=890399 RepID=A0A1V1PFN3_9BACT|nr:MAG: amino acid ABC transporter periplasmic protein [Candidatus Magnetoglobus multicellularis str. Araruama]
MKNRLICYAVFTFFILSVSVQAKESSLKRITIATGEWEPYISKNLKEYGVIPHIIRKAFSMNKINVKFQFVPWKRALVFSQRGKVSGVAVWGGYLSWAKDHYGSDPVMSGELRLWTLNDSPIINWRNPKEIEGMTLGVIRGEKGGEYLDNLINAQKLKIKEITHEEQKFKMLLAKRLDLSILNLDSGLVTIRKLIPEKDWDKIVPHPDPIRVSHYRVLFARQNPESLSLLEEFNDGLYKLKQQGVVDKMLKESMNGSYKPN